MAKARAALVVGCASICLALAGCGDSVAAGGENAATHPASGIWVARTVGGENISEPYPTPTVPFQPPSSTPPPALPSGQGATVAATESAVTGGCWQDAHAGDLYGAYDQLFWWQGQCADTEDQIAVELYPTVAAAKVEVDHATANALLARYYDGAVIVDVYSTAPLSVLAELSHVKGLQAVPGYGG